MLQELIDALSALSGHPVDAVAPSDKTRFIVCAPYMASSVYGDDANVLDIPRVQIDVYTPTPDDDLIEQVEELLQSWHLPYSVEDYGYDQETNRFRTILQLDVI